MKNARRVLVLVLAAAVSLLAVPSVASAQDDDEGYGGSYDETGMVVEEIARGTVDDDGSFSFNYEVPEDIDSDYDIWVTGTSADGGPFELSLASITPSYAGRTVALTASNLEPGSEYVLESRGAGGDPASPAAEDTETDEEEGDGDVAAASADDDEEEALGVVGDTSDSSNRRLLGGLAVVALLIAAAVVYGLRIAGREAY